MKLEIAFFKMIDDCMENRLQGGMKTETLSPQGNMKLPHRLQPLMNLN